MFKVGDKVRVVWGGMFFDEGDEFVVVKVGKWRDNDVIFVGHEKDNDDGWDPDRFKLVESLPLNHARAE